MPFTAILKPSMMAQLGLYIHLVARELLIYDITMKTLSVFPKGTPCIFNMNASKRKTFVPYVHFLEYLIKLPSIYHFTQLEGWGLISQGMMLSLPNKFPGQYILLTTNTLSWSVRVTGKIIVQELFQQKLKSLPLD